MNHLSSTRILPQFNVSLALCIDGEICGHVPSGYKIRSIWLQLVAREISIDASGPAPASCSYGGSATRQ